MNTSFAIIIFVDMLEGAKVFAFSIVLTNALQSVALAALEVAAKNNIQWTLTAQAKAR